MPTTVTVLIKSISGDPGPFTLFLRNGAGLLLNTGGDEMTETENPPGTKTGIWSASISENLAADYSAGIYEGTTETADNIVWDGGLKLGETELRPDWPISAVLTTEVTELLTVIGQRTAQITGARLSVAGPVTPGGQISLVVGSDYVDDIDSSLIRTVTDAGETLHDALTAGELTDLVFSAAPKANAASTSKISGTIAAVSHAGGVTSITIEIARANIPNGSYDEDWKYQIWRTTDDHVSPPLLEGQLLLNWRA